MTEVNRIKSVLGPVPDFTTGSALQWVRTQTLHNAERWELQLFSHRAFGALAVAVTWLKGQGVGGCTFTRNGEFLCPVSIPEDVPYTTLEDYQQAVWDEVKHILQQAHADLSDYLSTIDGVEPEVCKP